MSNLSTAIALLPIRSDNRFVTDPIAGKGPGIVSFFLDVAEAHRFGTDRVEVSQPVSIYLQDIYGQKTGMTSGPKVNTSKSNTKQAPLAPGMPSGIIRMIGITNDQARIDIDGDGVAESASILGAIGITSCDLTELAGVYRPGTSLHFAKQSHL